MKITTKLALNILLISIYFVLTFVEGLTDLWFTIALLMLAIKHLVFAVLYKKDSSTYLTSLLVYFSAMCYIMSEFIFNIYEIIYICIFGICFASFVIYLFFRQNIHLKIFGILIFEVILLVLIANDLIIFNEFILIQTIYLLFVFENLLKRVAFNTRRIS